jgi:hypothetical protein
MVHQPLEATQDDECQRFSFFVGFDFRSVDVNIRFGAIRLESLGAATAPQESCDGKLGTGFANVSLTRA